MDKDMITFFEVRNPTGKPVKNLTLGLESAASITINTFYENPANKYRKVEVMIMPEDVANEVRKYLEGKQ
ncbi:Uncharacterised protein [uncultured archaeon]|nr:Uncharacterised protein [uncultured archaeon]